MHAPKMHACTHDHPGRCLGVGPSVLSPTDLESLSASLGRATHTNKGGGPRGEMGDVGIQLAMEAAKQVTGGKVFR